MKKSSEILSLWHQYRSEGKTQTDLARDLGVTKQWVSYCLLKNGYRTRSRKNSCYLNSDEIAYIQSRYNEGAGTCWISEEMGLTDTLLARRLRRQGLTHLRNGRHVHHQGAFRSCSWCKQRLPIAAFYKMRSGNWCSVCRVCNKDRQKFYRQNKQYRRNK